MAKSYKLRIYEILETTNAEDKTAEAVNLFISWGQGAEKTASFRVQMNRAPCEITFVPRCSI